MKLPIWRIALVLAAPLASFAALPTEVKAAPRVPASSLITSKSIGPARLGMTVGALKRAFPGSVVVDETGPETRYVLKQNGREILDFLTRGQAILSDRSIVRSLNTSDPRFQLASGIRPGAWLHNAVKIYGRPSLEFWAHGESANFPKWNRKILFDVEAPTQSNSEYRVAGIYSQAELKSLGGTTTRFRAGTRITGIGCFE